MATMQTTIYLYAYVGSQDRTPTLHAFGYPLDDEDGSFVLLESRKIEAEVNEDSSFYVDSITENLKLKKAQIYAKAEQEVTTIDNKLARWLDVGVA